MQLSAHNSLMLRTHLHTIHILDMDHMKSQHLDCQKKSLVELKVSEYHLIFNLNGILLATREGPTKFS